ncbi:tRNA 2'-phosphotransferase 1-like [Ricinus communis]|uniref:tRNA 2'-phosphotransferase 1-like n=1 Tax=Ricinus communis TaxID=3988 RepID=UPI00201A964E|nr:tRNA 2'-phosphotransferase 1-like [Ricinus communis]
MEGSKRTTVLLELYSNSVTEALQKNRNKKSYHLVLGPADSQGLPNRLQCEGIRLSVNVLIYLDVKKALEDGMKLYVSDNRVILTEGFDGILCL